MYRVKCATRTSQVKHFPVPITSHGHFATQLFSFGVLVLKNYFAFAKTSIYSRFFSSIDDTAQKQSDQDAYFRHCNLRCLLDPSGYPLRHKPHNSWRLWHSQRSGHSKCTAWLLSKSTNVHPAQSTVQKEPGLLNLELDPTEELSNDRSQQGKELELTYLENIHHSI